MLKTPKRKIARIFPAAPLLLGALLLTACGGGSDAADGGGSSPSPSGKDKALAYSQCMRDNGVKDFPDPTDGGLKLTPESGVDMQSPEFKKAQEACRELSPMGEAGSGPDLDPVKVADWADCIRKKGVPDFPDPEVNGSQMEIDIAGLDPESPKFQEAMDACQDKRPGGGMIMKGGGGQ